MANCTGRLRADLKRTFGVHARALQDAPAPEMAIEALLDAPLSGAARNAVDTPRAAVAR